jgi:hypothetical protein
MQHLKRRPKRCVEVQDSRPKEIQENSEEIQEVGSQPTHWWHTGLSRMHQTVCIESSTNWTLGVVDWTPDSLANDQQQIFQRSIVVALNGRLTWLRNRTCLVRPTTETVSFLSKGYD